MTYTIKQKHINGYYVLLESRLTSCGWIYEASMSPMVTKYSCGYPDTVLTNRDLKKATHSFYYLCGKAKGGR